MMNKYIRIVLVGLLMGAAEVVPGVSGGTIAFVSGFYERLLNGIARLTPFSLLELPTIGFAAWWKKYDLGFMFVLFSAMLVSILILARGVSYLLAEHPVGIWSFFFGLVLSSIFVVGRLLLPLSVESALALGVGAAVGLVLVRIIPFEAEVSGVVLFAGGCVAVCAWILPGLSGSFVLLVLGLYQTVIAAIKNFELLTLGYVGLGCVVGLMVFSRTLTVLLTRFHDLTLALLVGFMFGSLAKIWPWEYTTSYQIKTDGGQIPVVQEAVLPGAYEQLTGGDSEVMLALAALVAGFIVIFLMNRFAFLKESNVEKDLE
jgi:putative membrane protein